MIKHSRLWVVVLVMGALISFIPTNSPAADTVTPPDTSNVSSADSVDFMRHHGERRSVEDSRIPIATKVSKDASRRIAHFRAECEQGRLFEIVLPQDELSALTLGFEVEALCEDSPSPAVGVFYDVTGRYLGSGSVVE